MTQNTYKTLTSFKSLGNCLHGTTKVIKNNIVNIVMMASNINLMININSRPKWVIKKLQQLRVKRSVLLLDFNYKRCG